MNKKDTLPEETRQKLKRDKEIKQLVEKRMHGAVKHLSDILVMAYRNEDIPVTKSYYWLRMLIRDAILDGCRYQKEPQEPQN